MEMKARLRRVMAYLSGHTAINKSYLVLTEWSRIGR
jgi:hypothetical protein